MSLGKSTSAFENSFVHGCLAVMGFHNRAGLFVHVWNMGNRGGFQVLDNLQTCRLSQSSCLQSFTNVVPLYSGNGVHEGSGHSSEFIVLGLTMSGQIIGRPHRAQNSRSHSGDHALYPSRNISLRPFPFNHCLYSRHASPCKQLEHNALTSSEHMEKLGPLLHTFRPAAAAGLTCSIPNLVTCVQELRTSPDMLHSRCSLSFPASTSRLCSTWGGSSLAKALSRQACKPQPLMPPALSAALLPVGCWSSASWGFQGLEGLEGRLHGCVAAAETHIWQEMGVLQRATGGTREAGVVGVRVVHMAVQQVLELCDRTEAALDAPASGDAHCF